MKKIGLVAKSRHPLAAEAVRTLRERLAARGYEPLVDEESARAAGFPSNLNRRELANAADLIVVFGGDGTFLSVARLVEGGTTPVMGVNLGSLGFLTEFTYDEYPEALDRILAGDYTAEDRIMLDVAIEREGRTMASATVLNDVVVTSSRPARMVDVTVHIDGLFVNEYAAAGLIVTTPTGSTAYNLSAGGPILHPSLSAVILSPICPHTLSNRPVVVPDRSRIELRLGHRSAGGEAAATLDGQVGYQFTGRDRIVVTRSAQAARVILSHDKPYYRLLREKLKWGEPPRPAAEGERD